MMNQNLAFKKANNWYVFDILFCMVANYNPINKSNLAVKKCKDNRQATKTKTNFYIIDPFNK